MVLSGLANKQLVSALTSLGARAVGISGEDDALLNATPIDRKAFGHSGVPTNVDTRLVEHLLAGGFLPVISPVAAYVNADTGARRADALNVNGDDAAAAIAAALGAAELFLLADVPGVLDENRNVIRQLTLRDARQLVASGIAAGGMAAKLDACTSALTGGVSRVRIGDIAALADASAGTHIVAGDDHLSMTTQALHAADGGLAGAR
jgi:acetylglutamate kinase